MASNVLQVSVTIVVPIDRTMWELEYGQQSSAQRIRESVKADADELVKSHFRTTGVLAESLS